MSTMSLLTIAIMTIIAISSINCNSDFNGRVFLNVPLTEMVSKGYTMIMNEPYAHITSADYLIKNIRSKCTAESQLCVGGADAITLTYQLVACGNCLEITSNTTGNLPKQVNGVFWYLTPNLSFGFSPISTINQAPFDTLTANGAERLSWPTLVAGYRIGNTMGAAAERKVMFLKEYPVSKENLNGESCYSGVECMSGNCVRKECSACPDNQIVNEVTGNCEVRFTELNNQVYVNVLVNEMALAGYTHIMTQSYSHITSDAFLADIRSQCNSETRLCVAGANSIAVTLQLVACGNCFQILSPTVVNIPVLENGVYWHYTPGFSFGFSSLIGVNQAPADLLMTNGPLRLSWPTQTGGFRIGSTLGAAAEKKMMFIKN